MDPAVVERARQGDAEAFAAIYAWYYPAIRRHAQRLLGNAEQADDLAQETFLRAYLHRHQILPDPQLRAWLYRIASNACMDALRRRKRVADRTLDETPEETTGLAADDFAPAVVERDAVHRALAAVRPELREPLVLYLGHGLTCSEIATRLHLTRGNVAVRLYRARSQFAQAYAQG